MAAFFVDSFKTGALKDVGLQVGVLQSQTITYNFYGPIVVAGGIGLSVFSRIPNSMAGKAMTSNDGKVIYL